VKIIEHINGKIAGDNNLQVSWVRFQKRLSFRGGKENISTQKKTTWKWISKVKDVHNKYISSPISKLFWATPIA